LSFFLFFFIVVLGGAHFSIYKGSCNVSTISYLNSPSTPPTCPLFPHSWNGFNRYHFCLYMHMYTFFAQYSPSYPHSLPPRPSTGANLPPALSHYHSYISREQFDLCFPSSLPKDWVNLKVKVKNMKRFNWTFDPLTSANTEQS
jgi:hypothetical protein